MKHVHPFASIALAAILLCGCTSSSPVEDEAEMLKALTTFLRAFENGDLDAMEASFSEDATSFRRTVMSNGITEPIEAAIYKRASGGLPPAMRELVASWQGRADGPPYMALDPKDLEVRMLTDAAIVTFHLENGRALSRRTLVLAKEDGSWKIVHLHPSNVVGSE